MNKKIFLWALIPFVIIMAASILFSYDDNRPADGDLTYGFPFTVYSAGSGFGFGPIQSGIHYWNFFMTIVLFYGVSFIMSYALVQYQE